MQNTGDPPHHYQVLCNALSVIYNYKNKALQDVLPQFLDAKIPTIETEIHLKR